MCRGSITACSRMTVASPNADDASFMAADSDSRSADSSRTSRIPRPPPPATALTNNGYVISPAAASRVSMSSDGSLESSTGTPASRAAATARCLLPAIASTRGGGPMKVMPASVARGRELRVLREEAVAGVDRVGARPPGGGDHLLDREVGPDRMALLADLVRLVGLEPVLGVAVLDREDGHRRGAELVRGAEAPDRDLPAVGHQHLAEHRPSSPGEPVATSGAPPCPAGHRHGTCPDGRPGGARRRSGRDATARTAAPERGARRVG